MRRSRLPAWTWLLLALVSAGCSGGSHLSLHHDGLRRSAVIDPPEGTLGPRPAIIVLHAATLSGSEARAELRISATAGLVLAFPDATGPVWNDLSFARVLPSILPQADDVGFLDALITSLVQTGVADPAAIHLAGVSNGGMMALRYACLRAERLASVTVFFATMALEDAEACRPLRPIGISFVAGTADPVLRWSGEATFAGLAVLQHRMSVPASFDFWRRANGCQGIAPARQLPRRGGPSEPHVIVHSATGCGAGVRTRLHEVRGGGHRLPGDTAWPSFWPLGQATTDFEAGAFIVEAASAEAGRLPVPAAAR